MAGIRNMVWAAASLCLAGCGAPSFPPPQQSSASAPALEAPTNFTLLSAHIVSPSLGGLDEPAYLIVRTAEEWAALWSKLEPRTAHEQDPRVSNSVPVIDFSKQAVIVAALGRKPNGGYRVELQSVDESSDRILVNVLETRPGSNCVVTLEETNPIAIAIISQTDKAVDFALVQRAVAC